MGNLLALPDLGRVGVPCRDGAQTLDHVEVEPLVPAKHMGQDLVSASPHTGALPSMDAAPGTQERARELRNRELPADAPPQCAVDVDRGAEELRPDRPERNYPGLQGGEVILDVPGVRDRALPGALLSGGGNSKGGSLAGVLELSFKKKSCQTTKS